jgi:ABC-2 type transport system ATP-binding protein
MLREARSYSGAAPLGSRAMSGSLAVQVEALDYRYPRRLLAPPRPALRAVDFAARAGEITGVLGPNGSGKSTLLKVLAGVLRPRGGRVAILGHAPGDRALTRRVAFQPEGPLPFPLLTGHEFLRMFGALRGLDRATARRSADEWVERVGLADARDVAVRAYSTGMARRLALAATLCTQPDVVLLDEPTTGIDPPGSLQARELLAAQRARGACVVLASHQLDEVEQLCDRVWLLQAGCVRRHGTLDELLGTGGHTLTVDGLDDAGLARVRAAVTAAGGRVAGEAPARRGLRDLFRELQRP